MISEDWIVPVIGFAFVFYGMVTSFLICGLRRITSQTTQQTPFVSVIVAARNEEENIFRLLDVLASQSYNAYEIIVIDDDSTDNTLSIARDYAARQQCLKVLSSDRSVSHRARKKAALTTGILASKGEILCFTDADCLPGREWLSELASQFTDKVGLVVGYSPYDSNLLAAQFRPSGSISSLFHHFIHYEEIKGAIWSAASIGLGRAWLCTGRNLAYRRKVWDQVSGFSRIMASISGDDDLFLQLVRRSTDWDISYVFNRKSIVPTMPPESFRTFIHQRTRHFSAGRYFTVSLKSFFFLFHTSNLVLFIGLIFGIFHSPLFLPAFAMFLGKVALDFFLVVKGASLLSEGSIWLRVVPMELLCLLYNTFIGPLGFIKDFEWKPNLTK